MINSKIDENSSGRPGNIKGITMEKSDSGKLEEDAQTLKTGSI